MMSSYIFPSLKSLALQRSWGTTSTLTLMMRSGKLPSCVLPKLKKTDVRWPSSGMRSSLLNVCVWGYQVNWMFQFENCHIMFACNLIIFMMRKPVFYFHSVLVSTHAKKRSSPVTCQVASRSNCRTRLEEHKYYQEPYLITFFEDPSRTL